MAYLTPDPLDWSALLPQPGGPYGTTGAWVTFAGIVRADCGPQGRVRALVYETYPEMAELHIDRIVAAVSRRWPGVRASVRHRAGRVAVGELSVLVGVAAAHRAEAYAACRQIVEAIKHDVPIWKRAEYDDGTRCWDARGCAASEADAATVAGGAC